MRDTERSSSLKDGKALLLAILLTFVLIVPEQRVYAQAAQAVVYLPLIANTTAVTNASPTWQLNTQEEELELLFRNDPGQHRLNPTRNEILSKVARARAEDMAQRNYFSHTDPDGHQANFLVSQAGYALPNYFPANSNNVESIGLNYATAAEVWQAWKNSPAHRIHVLGEEPFFADETDYGLGYAESNIGRYWVIITAHH